jgi:hypothetical protein
MNEYSPFLMFISVPSSWKLIILHYVFVFLSYLVFFLICLSYPIC